MGHILRNALIFFKALTANCACVAGNHLYVSVFTTSCNDQEWCRAEWGTRPQVNDWEASTRDSAAEGWVGIGNRRTENWLVNWRWYFQVRSPYLANLLMDDDISKYILLTLLLMLWWAHQQCIYVEADALRWWGDPTGSCHGSEKPRFFKKPNPLDFLGFIGFWALLVFKIFCLNEQLGSLLVDLTHQLSFYLDFLVL